MSSPSQQSPSLIVRFLDSFLQERNIKWVLAVGMMILFGSSLLLVTSHWENYTQLWQNLIVLAYSAAVHVAGQWTYHRLGLRRTGTILQGLTVLLIPVLFLAIHWLPAREQIDNAPGPISQLFLLAATVGFSVLAARRIFAFALRSTQPTFLICYLLLAIAGAVVPLTPPDWAPVVVAALWGTFALGAVKVSRHVFWLTEDRRAPRVLGFFPIVLLGGQFLFLYVAHPALHIAPEWIGFGCVLVALPVLMTADSIVRVFQQRTGDLVRPLPWSIVLPVLVGVILCAAGVVLSGLSLVPPNRPHALVVTAAMAAGLMVVLARRTSKEAFVWAMLLGLMIAYQFSPMIFKEIVDIVLKRGATLVNEKRLPFAFYGLTYLPFLAVALYGARRAADAGNELFARPLWLFIMGATSLLWALSLTHEKAMFPVGLALVGIAAMQVRVLRFWPALVPALLAWISAAYGLPTFATQVLDFAPLADAEVGSLTVAAAILFLCGWLFDGSIVRLLPSTLARIVPHPCASTSLILTLALAGVWFDPNATPNFVLTGIALGGLLVAHALKTGHATIGTTAIVFVQAIVVRSMIAAELTPGQFVSLTTWLLLGQWLLGTLLENVVHGANPAMLLTVNRRVCAVWLASLMLGIYLPLFAFDLLAATKIAPDFIHLHEIAWSARILMVLWTLDLARRLPSIASTALAHLSILASVASASAFVFGVQTWLWLPTVLAGTGLVLLAATEWLASRNRDDIRARTATALTDALFAIIALGSLFVFDWPMRIAGLTALVGLARLHWRDEAARYPLAIVLNLQLLSLAATFVEAGSHVRTLVDHVPLFALPLAAVAAASLVVWQVLAIRSKALAQHQTFNFNWILRAICVVGLAAPISHHLKLDVTDALLAGGAFVLIASAELIAACRTRIEARVWIAEAIILAGVLFFLHFRVVTLHHGYGMFAILGVGLALNLLKHVVAQNPTLAILSRPFHWTSFAMPLLTVAVGITRHANGVPFAWLGGNSLALLLAAAFYFWRGIEDRCRLYHVTAAVILNIALLLLWSELQWTDAQFYMVPIGISILALVELLKREIPETFHNPLRYLGALVILVSPTFHIVDGSWVHLLTLMVAAVAIALIAIGLRIRALLYMGAAFLVADLAAMLVRGSMDDSNILWIAGFVLGAGIIALGAYCEKHRELLLSRMHLLASTLKTWE